LLGAPNTANRGTGVLVLKSPNPGTSVVASGGNLLQQTNVERNNIQMALTTPMANDKADILSQKSKTSR
jgi:hypothetical protein